MAQKRTHYYYFVMHTRLDWHQWVFAGLAWKKWKSASVCSAWAGPKLVTSTGIHCCLLACHGGHNAYYYYQGYSKVFTNKDGYFPHLRMPLDSFKTLCEKWLFKKLMQILNDPTHPMRHYFDSRRSNRSGRFWLTKTNTNLPSALSVFNENYDSH